MRQEGEYDEAAFAVLRNVLGGMLHASAGIECMGDSERRAVEWRVAAAIGNAQDVVHDMSDAYDQVVRTKRAEVRAWEEATW